MFWFVVHLATTKILTFYSKMTDVQKYIYPARSKIEIHFLSNLALLIFQILQGYKLKRMALDDVQVLVSVNTLKLLVLTTGDQEYPLKEIAYIQGFQSPSTGLQCWEVRIKTFILLFLLKHSSFFFKPLFIPQQKVYFKHTFFNKFSFQFQFSFIIRDSYVFAPYLDELLGLHGVTSHSELRLTSLCGFHSSYENWFGHGIGTQARETPKN